ncbi:ThuA domain-containing protein [Mangrovibrevibacter kandeliae]|uniref:ThuA domain-containing protein n=1 Tax=Mangrovibrevibacter kandeliae TaxID=2968473 RepID=UPI0021179E9B|nr:ThuA domain-containing protein [Aurantimonas sp. CSK15Z-1]MCQ8780615.1 ThuA domain-containing protein [Aurantimonas sp. CSK15Z-1]
MSIRTVVWNEFKHERENATVTGLYPDGIHAAIAGALREDPEFEVSTATLPEPEHGLPQARLDQTDVLLWWGHKAHDEVDDAVVERVAQRVHEGMGLIVLHSGHYSKIFKRLMGTPCSLRWRVADERERLWAINRSHPIAQGIGPCIELPRAEMYGEPFLVPEPMETVFISWFEGGEVFRSGLTYQRGAGKIFYFRPGHETYPIYHEPAIQTVLRNAVRWAYNPVKPWADVAKAPNVPVGEARERIGVRAPNNLGRT